MTHSYSLLPKSNVHQKIHLLLVLLIVVGFWAFNGFYSEKLNHDRARLSLQIDTLKQYKSALNVGTDAQKNYLIYNDHITTQSSISFHVIELLKQYPQLTLLNLNKLTPSKRTKKMQDRPPKLPKAAQYLKLLQGYTLTPKAYSLNLSGPYDQLALFLEQFMSTSKPLLLQRLTLSGKNHPNDELTLNLAFFTKET